MCCRYYMESSEELRPYVEAAKRSPLTDTISSAMCRPMVTDGEVRPADIVPVIAPSRSQAPTVFPMVWGFHLPRSSAPVINARVESAMQKPTFRESWEKRRCVIPASYYFEWEQLVNGIGKKKTGDRYMIQPRGSHLTFLAGLYRLEEIKGSRIPVFTILTREPAEDIRFIHDRMPLILPKECIRDWVNPESKPADIIEKALTDMVFEKTG